MHQAEIEDCLWCKELLNIKFRNNCLNSQLLLQVPINKVTQDSTHKVIVGKISCPIFHNFHHNNRQQQKFCKFCLQRLLMNYSASQQTNSKAKPYGGG